MDLLNPIEKASFAAALEDLFDTFSKPIVVYKTPTKVIISQDANFNFAFGDNDKGVDVDYVPVSGVFEAKIHYEHDKLSPVPVGAGGELRTPLDQGVVRLKVRQDAYLFLKDCERVEFEGKTYNVVSDFRPRFIFGAKFYIFYLNATS